MNTTTNNNNNNNNNSNTVINNLASGVAVPNHNQTTNSSATSTSNNSITGSLLGSAVNHHSLYYGLGQQQQHYINHPSSSSTTTNNLLSSLGMGGVGGHPNQQLHHLTSSINNGYPSSSNLSNNNLSSLQSTSTNSLLSHPSLSSLHHVSGLLDQQLSFNHVRGTATNSGLIGSNTLPISSSLNNLGPTKLNTVSSLKNISHHELPINEFNSSPMNEQDAPPVPPSSLNNSSFKTETNPSSNSNNEKTKSSTNNTNNNNMANMQKEMSNMMKRPRRVAKLACVSCRKAHACCEDKRPCSRCLAHGLECQDQVGKKRGRKKKSGEEDNDNEDFDDSTENNRSTVEQSEPVQSTTNDVATASSSNATVSDKKKKKKKASSPKKKKEKQSSSTNNQLKTQDSSLPSEPVPPVQTTQRLQQQMMNANHVNTHNLQHLTESELKTPGAMLTSGNVIFPNRDNHPLSLPFLLNQPPEIQQLTQILMRTPVDTFFLHCNNLNAAYDYQNNQSLFGTPYSLHVDEALLNQNRLQQQQYLNNISKMNHQLVSPGGVPSPLIDFTNDEFLRFSPQSPMFESIVEMDPLEIHNEVGHIMPSYSTTSNEEYERVKPQSNSNNSSLNNVNNNDDVQIEDCQDDNNQKTASSSKQEEEIFERLKRMSNEEMIKSLQIGDDTKQMIEESIGHLKQFDSNPETANMTYIEYLTQNFPISLLLRHKLNDSAKKLATSNETVEPGNDIQKEINSLREENKRLKEENLRKANESAMLSAINENLRNRFSELASKGIIKMQYDEPPTYGENNKPTAIQDSYQELVMLMENKQEMDSSDFGIILMFPGGRIISLNKTLLTKLNYDPSDLYDNLERWEDVVHPESYPQIIAHVSRVLKTPPAPRKSFKCKVNCRKRGGGMIPAELYLCIVGGKFSYIPVFAIGYFLFEDSQKPNEQQEQHQ